MSVILQVFYEKTQARKWVVQQRADGRTVGLVPTMGALHEGHFSLVRRSAEACDQTIATIFVNPTQFGPGEDLSRYPRTLDEDLRGLRSNSVDAVFIPQDGAMYRATHSTFVDPPSVAGRLEGQLRPHHFRGVSTVVLKLMNILPADIAFFGQKDYQQAAVIREMVIDLDLPMQIEVCPIIRDPDGLAMSSRNRYLSDAERSRALSLSRALQHAERLIVDGERRPARIEQEMRDVMNDAKVDTIDYAVAVDGIDLSDIELVRPNTVLLVAARIGSTRLIDNWLWKG